MSTLRIVRPPRVHLVDNFPRRNDPRKNTGLRIVRARRVHMGAATAVTLSGTVKDGSQTVLAGRTVRVFGDQGMILYLGSTSSAADGTFSITVPSGPGSRYTLVAQGEPGDNGTVFANVIKTT